MNDSKMFSRLKWLIDHLDNACDKYYNDSISIMTDKEYDDLYDELLDLENKLDIHLDNSPTSNVGYKVVDSNLKEVLHDIPLLSLGKTKEVDKIIKFIGDESVIIMDKLDGLTLKVEYINGKLHRVSTRGDGEVGYDVTHNAVFIDGIIDNLKEKIDIDVVGECVVTWGNFDKYNENKSEEDKFSHPRSMASGSIRQIDNRVVMNRALAFKAFDSIKNDLRINSKSELLDKLEDLGFSIVDHVESCPTDIVNSIRHMSDLKSRASTSLSSIKYLYPLDGLVISFDNIKYGKSLGITGHHPKHSIALKWEDEVYETEILDIIEDVGKYGQISFRAKFKPVEIEGSIIEYATLHNYNIIRELGIGVGAIVEIYKANKIIPKVHRVIKKPVEVYEFSGICPSCGSKTSHKINLNGKASENLYCVNEDCEGINYKRILHFVGKKGMDIEGLSKSTIKVLLEPPLIANSHDIYDLHEFVGSLVKLNRFGEKKVDKLLKSIEKSKTTSLDKFIYAIGIENVGTSISKHISERFVDYDEFYASISGLRSRQNPVLSAMEELDLSENIAHILMSSETKLYLDRWYNCIKYYGMKIESKSKIKSVQGTSDSLFSGKLICVTGKLTEYTRNTIEEAISNCGAKFTKSVNSKTDILICNEISESSKYKKAIDLGINIITEEEFTNGK